MLTLMQWRFARRFLFDVGRKRPSVPQFGRSLFRGGGDSGL